MKSRLLELPGDATPVAFGGKTIAPLMSQYGAARFVRFFLSKVTSEKCRKDQACAIAEFCHWADHCGHDLDELGPITVSIYLERLGLRLAMPAVKVHAEALRVLFDWFVGLRLLRENPVPTLGEIDQMETHGLPAAQKPRRGGYAIDIVAYKVAS